MAKGRGRQPGPRGQKNMMKQIQKMQEDMLAEQEALGNETVEVSVGGGAIKVVMTGHQKVESIHIDPELLSPTEGDMLAELLMAAVNQAVEQSQAMAGTRMQGITSGLNLPPGLGF